MNKILSIILLPVIASCSSLKIENFKNTTPEFRIEDYFLGEVKASGVVLDRSGMPIKQFVVEIKGTLNAAEKTLTLNEDFNYADGKVENRVWTIKILDDGNYEGYAKDVSGYATGRALGQALNWRYTLQVPYDNSTIEIDFNDWMFLQNDNKTLVNKAVMTKYGFYVGEVLLFFSK